MHRTVKVILTMCLSAWATVSAAGAGRAPARPDFDKIKTETLNPASQFYYPSLLKLYLSSDTTMTDEQYHYLYYGTVFQEDYNPYRTNPYEAETKAAAPLYSRAGARSRSENTQVQKIAEKTLTSNPFDLRQISSLIYTYGASGKQNLAKIWQHKFDKIIYTISRSGSGIDKDHPIYIIDPANSMDFFFLSNVTVESTEFQEPYYEVFTVTAPGQTEPRQYWFNLHQILEQYYKKHPSEQ